MRVDPLRILCFALLLAGLFAAAPQAHLRALAQGPAAATAAADFKITGAVDTPLDLSIADLKKMPRTMLKVVNPHDQKTKCSKASLSRSCSAALALRREKNSAAQPWPRTSSPKAPTGTT